MASEPSRKFIVHTSTSQMGGAETSLLEAIASIREKPLFLVPAEGPLTKALAERGLAFRVLTWPAGLSSLTQSRWLALPLILPGLIPYLIRLRATVRGVDTLWSSGLKSHCSCLLLAPWLGKSLLFDIRDFLRPRLLRKAIAGGVKYFGCRVRANSKSVGNDYPSVKVYYPIVKTLRPPVDKRRHGGKLVITHLAYFAPYKGQDLFLDCARKLLDAGVDAEFWIIGDVIYPAETYKRYREMVHARAASLQLSTQVRFFGKVGSTEEVQALLEQTHLLLHCTREPEPYGRAVMEALLCGCEVICHRESGVCEVTRISDNFSKWLQPLQFVLGKKYVQVALPLGVTL